MSEQQRLIALLEEMKMVNEEIRDELRTISAFCTPVPESDLENVPGSGSPGRQFYEFHKVGDMFVLKTKNPLLDDQDAMQLLKISSRTLRRRRANKVFPFTQQEGKFYYRYEDLIRSTKPKKRTSKPKKK